MRARDERMSEGVLPRRRSEAAEHNEAGDAFRSVREET
jgi:hypothetical protein